MAFIWQMLGLLIEQGVHVPAVSHQQEPKFNAKRTILDTYRARTAASQA